MILLTNQQVCFIITHCGDFVKGFFTFFTFVSAHTKKESTKVLSLSLILLIHYLLDDASVLGDAPKRIVALRVHISNLSFLYPRKMSAVFFKKLVDIFDILLIEIDI